MNDDSKIPLRKIIEYHGKSIASILLDIGENKLRQRKCLEFITNLECLEVDSNSSEGLRLMRKTINAFIKQDYVALSYTWDNSDHENPRKGKYEVHNRNELHFFRSPVRDCVFDRVLSYMRVKGLSMLWIDRHCVKQRTCRKDACPHKRCNEKYRAVETMDLVYSLSKHPVALLGKPIEWAHELDLLSQILDGTLVEELNKTDHDKILQALALLDRITKDRWWTRAWTFQENYRGMENMTLLIRHPEFLEKRKQSYRCFSDVPNELCISSKDFCTASTQLCLKAAEILPPGAFSYHSEKILRAAGRYTKLLDKSLSMTPTVINDIGTRRLSDAWDKLAIIANCCQYAIRMDHRQMQKPRSLSLSILAMCLLNGEIFQNGSRKDSPLTLEKSLPEFLEDQAFEGFCAPKSVADLTFNKGCRFVDVEFNKRGVKTKGHLWKLGRIIDPARFHVPLEKMQKNPYSLSENVQRHLTKLATELRRLRETTLAIHIERFLSHDPNKQGENSKNEPFSRWYMGLMAEELATAIEENKLLRLGSVWNLQGNKNPYSAIFIWDLDSSRKTDIKDQQCRRNINRNRDRRPEWEFAFTSSRPLERGSGGRGTNDLDHHVSLEVGWPSLKAQSSGDHPELFIKRWIVGLCFFYDFPRTDVIFRWPSSFQTAPC